MAFPQKPASPALDGGDPFNVGLVAAWLFTDGSGTTVTDYASTPHNLTVTAGSGGTWGDDGTRQTFLSLSNTALDVGSDVAALKFTDTQEWTFSFLVRRTGAGAGALQRLMQRTGDLQDMGWNSGDSFKYAYFNGTGWRDSGFPAGSGAVHMVQFVRTEPDHHVHVYVDGVEQIDEGNTGIVQQGAITFGRASAGAEYIDADISAIWIHNRALTPSEITAFVADPYASVTPGPSAPVADFSGTPLSGTRGVEVTFTDLSTNTPTSWLWDFGDGASSTDQNPVHSYGDGTFTVVLTASNAGGSDSETKSNYITVTAPTTREDDELTEFRIK